MQRVVERVGRALNALSASWMFLLAFVVLIDVVGRAVFGRPLVGIPEIVANSIVAVTFLQLPYAISAGAMIHTPIILGAVPALVRRLIEALVMLSGVILFLALAYASWEPTLTSWQTGEYFGEGALRVPTVYTRAIIVVMSVFSAVAYAVLAVGVVTGRYSMVARRANDH